MCLSVIAYSKACAVLTDFSQYSGPQWDLVTSNDVKELKGRLVRLRAKWEFGTTILTAGTKHQHVTFNKDNKKD